MGILGYVRDSVIVVNRTTGGGEYERELTIRYDGEEIIVKPGEEISIPKVVVPYAKKQNPLMGSQDSINPNRYISLIGVKGEKNSEPLSFEVLEHAATKWERVDRDGDFGGEPLGKRVPLRKRPFDPYEAQVSFAGTGFESSGRE